MPCTIFFSQLSNILCKTYKQVYYYLIAIFYVTYTGKNNSVIGRNFINLTTYYSIQTH